MSCQICNFTNLKKIFIPYQKCINCGWLADDFLELHFSNQKNAESVKEKYKSSLLQSGYFYCSIFQRDNIWVLSIPVALNTMIIDPKLEESWSYANNYTVSDYRKIYPRLKKLKSFE